MALLWCDGFDHYGTGSTGRTNMLQGVWAEINSGITPSATTPRTGTACLSTGTILNNLAVARRVFPTANLATVGFGYGLYMAQLPAVSNVFGLAQFRDGGNTAQLSFVLTTAGEIEVKRGGATGTLLAISAPVVTAGSYQHFECRATCDDTAGAVEVRVNGVTVIDISGVDTRNSAAGLMTQVAFGNISTGTNLSNVIPRFDDMFAWDTSGSEINDFIGPQRAYLLVPDADTAADDWVPDSGVTGYTQIDEVPPDGDTSYIEAQSTPGDISEFALEDLPPEISAVTALYVTPMLRKLTAGTANVQVSMISNAAVAAGADRPITEVYTYWADVFPIDPDTGAPWTAAAVNAALLRLEKTA